MIILGIAKAQRYVADRIYRFVLHLYYENHKQKQTEVRYSKLFVSYLRTCQKIYLVRWKKILRSLVSDHRGIDRVQKITNYRYRVIVGDDIEEVLIESRRSQTPAGDRRRRSRGWIDRVQKITNYRVNVDGDL